MTPYAYTIHITYTKSYSGGGEDMEIEYIVEMVSSSATTTVSTSSATNARIIRVVPAFATSFPDPVGCVCVCICWL